MTAKAGYPYITQALKRILQTETLPDGVYPAIDPDTYEGWYELIVWNDENIQKPSKENLKEVIDQIKLERQTAGFEDQSFDVIV